VSDCSLFARKRFARIYTDIFKNVYVCINKYTYIYIWKAATTSTPGSRRLVTAEDVYLPNRAAALREADA